MSKPKCYGKYNMDWKCQWCDWHNSCYEESDQPECFGKHVLHMLENNENKCKECNYYMSCTDYAL